MVGYIYLAVAIVAEVTGTVALKLSDGFSNLLPSVVVVVGYAVAFLALARTLKEGMPVGVAYAIWAAVGIALIAVIGAAFLGEAFTFTTAAGLGLIIGGVTVLELGRAAQ